MLFSKWSQFIHIDFKQLRQTLNFPLRTLILIIDSEKSSLRGLILDLDSP